MMANSSDAAQKCSASDTQLVVVDIQQKLGDAMPGKVLNRVLQNTALLLRSASLLGIPVIHAEQYPEGLGPTHATVAEALPAATRSFRKTTFSCLATPSLKEALLSSDVCEIEHRGDGPCGEDREQEGQGPEDPPLH
jgi:hypothetical protein